MPRAAGEGWRRVWNIRKNGGIEVRNLMEIVDGKDWPRNSEKRFLSARYRGVGVSWRRLETVRCKFEIKSYEEKSQKS